MTIAKLLKVSLAIAVYPFSSFAQNISPSVPSHYEIAQTLKRADKAMFEADRAKAEAEKVLKEITADQKETEIQALKRIQQAKRNLQIGGQWEERLRKAARGGGGAIDGGGGNLETESNQLFELAMAKGVTRLDSDELRTTIDKQLNTRLNNLENEMPGFRIWLFQALGKDMIWALDSKPLNEDVCKNYNINKAQQTVTACQSLRRINLSKQWYENKKIAQTMKIPVLVHELVRYHGIRLARENNLPRDMQDDIVAEVTRNILDPSVSGSQVYKILVHHGLLLGETELKAEVIMRIANNTQAMAALLPKMQDLLKLCKNSAVNAADVKHTYIGILSLLQRQENYCQQITYDDLANFGQCPNVSDQYSALYVERCSEH